MDFYDKPVFLHIGSFKTGSTAIQAALKAVKSDLLYPQYGRIAPNGERASHAHLRQELIVSASNPEALERIRTELLAEIAAADAPRVVISCEYFSDAGFLKKGLAALRTVLRGFDVTVLYYIRDRVSHFESSYYQACKRGIFSGTAAEYIASYHSAAGAPYAHVRDRFSEAFGEDRVRMLHYERTGGDILGHFCDQIEVAPIEFRRPRAVNFSTTASASLLMRRVLDQLRAAGMEVTMPMRRQLLRAVADLGDKTETVLDPYILARLEQLYGEDATRSGCTDFSAWPARLGKAVYIDERSVETRMAELIRVLLLNQAPPVR